MHALFIYFYHFRSVLLQNLYGSLDHRYAKIIAGLIFMYRLWINFITVLSFLGSCVLHVVCLAFNDVLLASQVLFGAFTALSSSGDVFSPLC